MVRFHISGLPETIGECLHSAFPDEALMWAHAYYLKIAQSPLWMLEFNTEFFQYYYGRYEYPYEIHDMSGISQILNTLRIELQMLYPTDVCDADAMSADLMHLESCDLVDAMSEPQNCPPLEDGSIGVCTLDYIEMLVNDGCSDPHFITETLLDNRHWASGVPVEQWAAFFTESQVEEFVAQIKSEITRKELSKYESEL